MKKSQTEEELKTLSQTGGMLADLVLTLLYLSITYSDIVH
jgi:hypothetical protein